MPLKDPKARAAYLKEYRRKNGKKLRAYTRHWHGTPSGLVSKAKARAKEAGLAFGIVPADVEIPKRCPILGIRLKRGVGQLCDASPTLDQIEPGKGYVKGNVMVVSHKSNRMKNDATRRELLLFAGWINRTYG